MHREGGSSRALSHPPPGDAGGVGFIYIYIYMYNEESSRALSHPPLGLEDIRAIKYNIYIYIYIYYV